MTYTPPHIPSITIGDLIERHDALFFDAFGVLVDAHGPMPGAVALIRSLNDARKPYLVLTNDASRLPATAAARYQQLGLSISAAQVITSGSLLTPYFAQQGLKGARCWVLGTDDSRQEVLAAGGELLDHRDGLPDDAIDALIVCDDEGYPFLPTVERALSLILRRLSSNAPPIHLILPNPDLIYPKRPGHFGFTSGGVALLIEHALSLRHPDAPPSACFVRLGKPFPAIFDAARQRLPAIQDPVMIGDQLPTDILGAQRAGIASALVPTGLSAAPSRAAQPQPTYLLPTLEQ
jgi:HAD superfamily hydrolase (TIGR01450 family)